MVLREDIGMSDSLKKHQSWETVKDRFVLMGWLLAGVMFVFLGLVNVLRLHHLFYGALYLVLAAGAFLIALRYKRKHFPKLVPRNR